MRAPRRVGHYEGRREQEAVFLPGPPATSRWSGTPVAGWPTEYRSALKRHLDGLIQLNPALPLDEVVGRARAWAKRNAWRTSHPVTIDRGHVLALVGRRPATSVRRAATHHELATAAELEVLERRGVAPLPSTRRSPRPPSAAGVVPEGLGARLSAGVDQAVVTWSTEGPDGTMRIDLLGPDGSLLRTRCVSVGSRTVTLLELAPLGRPLTVALTRLGPGRSALGRRRLTIY